MSQVFVGNGRASLPERSESPSAGSGVFANNLRLYTSLAHTPTPPESWLRLCLYAPVGTPATAPNFTPCASGPQAVTTATSAATTPAVIPSAKP